MVVQTLEEGLDFDGPGGCWLWTGHQNELGYGRVYVSGAGQRMVHRVVYELLVGPIPDGLEPDHLCRVPACSNPDHLEPVTHAENIRRGMALRTSCPHGHAYTQENTYTNSRGHRFCRRCNRERARARTRRG